MQLKYKDLQNVVAEFNKKEIKIDDNANIIRNLWLRFGNGDLKYTELLSLLNDLERGY